MFTHPGTRLLNVAIFVCSAGALFGGDAPKASVEIGAENEAAILTKIQEHGPRDIALEKAAAFLLTRQNGEGGFGEKHQNALTGLAVMSLLATGHTPDDPAPFGPAIKRALNYVLSNMRDDGYLGQKDDSKMYGHGICTLMLTEAAGMTSDELLERRLVEASRRGVKLILAAQAIKKDGANQGGWRYEPTSGDSDLSLTGWQTMALRSAKNIGVEVPNSAIEAAIRYIRTVAEPKGGFGYQNREDHATLRGIGLLALPVCGVYDAPELVASTKKMFQDPPNWNGPWFYYRIYYSSVGMYQMGDEAWNRFYPIVDDLLIKKQSPDGSWPDPPGNNEWDAGGNVYTTSMAMLALAIHNHWLPIYQR